MPLHPDFVDELRKHFTGQIRLDLASRLLYSTDASIYQLEPLGVVLPKTQDDLHAAVELAAKYKVPILPRGSGSSLAGQAIGHALIIDCSRWLDTLLEIDPQAHTATVEPGVILTRLNTAAARHGLMFGPDPASAERATMGGVIANNATGAHSLTYGMSADHLLSADVIMADGSLGVLGEQSSLDNPRISALSACAAAIREKYAGEIRKRWPTTWRNSAGYRLNYLLAWSPSQPSQWEGRYPNLTPGTWHLAPLLAGSEGTLAIIRRATVNLVPKPKNTILAVLAYQSNAEACDDVPRLLTHRPSAVELVPRMIIRLARGVPEYARQMGWVVGDPAALLVVEFSGDHLSALEARARGIGEVLTVATSKEEQARVWNIRKVGLGLLDSRPQSARPAAFVEDCAIPVDRLGDYVREVERILAEHGTEGGIYAHASAGCLHTRPILDLKTRRGMTDLRSISEAIFALTVSVGGAMSSEHGDGLARSEYLQQTYGPELMQAMRALKQAADPDDLLNRGKIFDTQKMDENLRYGPDYRAQVWQTDLSFERNGGLDVAIEQCNGQGVCRKDTGVMCPSYQATREEMHSTRGRANLLRAMISRPWTTDDGPSSVVGGLSSFDPQRVEAAAQALDLCLACKGCKSECPSGVDMAKLKFAFQAEYYRTHVRQLRDYAFGYFHITAGLAASVAPLTNALMAIPLIRRFVAWLLGITPERPFPKFSRRRAKFVATEHTEKKRVIFLADPFARYIEPETEQAALDILSRCGFDVQVLPLLGAGASFLSKGFISQAQAHAGRVLDALNEIDPARKLPVLGIEPPEIYTFKHDYLDLLPARAEEIRQRVNKVWLLDEFLLRSSEFDNLRIASLKQSSNPEEKSSPTKIHFHPHCHQRAEGPSPDGRPNGTNATLELLRSCGYEVELMDTGCCGMAGTFGYEAEHYVVSMKVGELKLFPEIRNWKGESGEQRGESSEVENRISHIANAPQVAGSRKSSIPKGTQAVVNRKSSIVSSGAACRMQIRQGTGVEAVHPIMLVAGLLKGLAG